MELKKAYKFVFSLLVVIFIITWCSALAAIQGDGLELFSKLTLSSGSFAGLAFALSGYVRECKKKASGVKALYLNESKNVTAHTPDVANGRIYSALVHSSPFVKYDFEQDQCELKETVTFENGSLKVTTQIIFKMGKMSPEISKSIMDMANASYCGMEAVALDNSGNQWYIGYSEEQKDERPLKLGGAEGTTGKALSDESGDTVTLTCETTEKMYTYSGTVASLTI